MTVRQPAVRDRLDEAAKKAVVVLGVDADPGLDRDRQADGMAHRPHAGGDQLGLGHQAGAEAGALDPVRGAADVEVDLVVAGRLAERRGARELVRDRRRPAAGRPDARPDRSAGRARAARAGSRRSGSSRYRAAPAWRSAAGSSGSAGRCSPSSARSRGGGQARASARPAVVSVPGSIAKVDPMRQLSKIAAAPVAATAAIALKNTAPRLDPRRERRQVGRNASVTKIRG